VVLHDSEKIPDPKPVESMQACDAMLSELPVGFSELPVAEAVELLAVNHAVDATFYFDCKRKHEDLTRWIGKQ
jgi:hypothetical protein